ncbi:MAG: PSD1 domain-containing protein [Planctomycetes bacterium]|nr:PSD1 domain-containing protein [Planctomycetota bacterium]
MTATFRVTILLSLLGWQLSARAVEPTVDFARDVYPILQRTCLECHGTLKQQGGLRLDSREGMLKGGDSGNVIVPGQPAKSELMRRISLTRDDPEVMPNRGDVLSKADVDRIRQWIAAGAPWADGVKPAAHWAYVAPVRPQPPLADIHPVDAFVRQRLQQAELVPSPMADLAILCRRLHLDLTGLPPTPAVVDAFVAAGEKNVSEAVETLTAELLNSPQYGEKWARPWLDAARYADSHGFQRDDLRDLWPYRDWVITALNNDMPFDQFTIEQLAGDLLPNATESQKIATGFNRCAPCNVEAGTDPEENRVNQVFDRVNTLGAVWLGTTLECCQCHNHKYDPFTTRDYYGLFAFFNQTELEADRSKPKVPGSIRFLGPYMSISDPHNAEKRRHLTTEVTRLKTELTRLENEAAELAATRTDSTSPRPFELHILKPTDFRSDQGADHRLLDDGSVLLLGDPPAVDTYTVTVPSSLKGIVGFKLETLTDPSLPGMGPGRGDPDRTNFILNEFNVTLTPADRQEARPEPVKLTDARADFSQQKWDVAGAIDGDPKSGWAIAPAFHQPHWAMFRAVKPLPVQDNSLLTFKLIQKYGSARTIGRLRISAITGEYPQPAVSTKDSPEQTALKARLVELEKQLQELGQPRTLVMQTIVQPRPTMMLQRGDFRAPGDAIEPSTPAVLPPLQTHDGELPNRLTLARWLVRRDNPVVARVTVNRIWGEIFGDGLVSTPEDFGIKGERPSHPELLDWLAVEFMENGWSRKKLLQTIVTSETYRQSSRITPELLEVDPHNRMLARGPRFRLSAESIRDNALEIAGLLSRQQFGPPIRPAQPAGLWDKVGGEKYEYVVSPGSEQYRRGIYVVLKRMSPYPSFISFDATARLACRVKRVRSNTPLQALVLLNDPVYVAAARAFAQRIQHDEVATDLTGKLKLAFRLAVSRSPRATELAVLERLYNAERMSAGGRDEPAWFAVASALLNLDETITKN